MSKVIPADLIEAYAYASGYRDTLKQKNEGTWEDVPNPQSSFDFVVATMTKAVKDDKADDAASSARKAILQKTDQEVISGDFAVIVSPTE